MDFTQTSIEGVFILDVKRNEDERGFFGRIWCRKEFEENGIKLDILQINTAVSYSKGTLRGMHYQEAPYAETKVVRCTKGSVFDVALDIRPASRTFKKWFGIELSSENQRMLVVPPGCAHGYQTLEDETELMYITSEFYNPPAAKGLRYNDQAFDIKWPLQASIVSQADANWPFFTE
jgi:dTDP-4-dehydrorhamnose 3,5-epimerase